jgi:hypothetical protein
MKFYYIPNTYSAQIENTGLSFRFRYTCFGIAPKTSFWHRRTIDLPKWYILLFGWHFAFFHHTSQRGQWNIFNIHLGALQFWLRTKGDGRDKYTGFHIAWRGLKGWRLLF